MTEDCYTGPAGTQGIGVCKQGSRDCDASGHWTTCAGEVTPVQENCQTNPDESCAPNCGEHVSHRAFFSDAEEYLENLAIAANGDLLLIGNSVAGSGLDFGGGALNIQDDGQIVLARLLPTLGHVWSQTYPFTPVRSAVASGNEIGVSGMALVDTTVGGTAFVSGDRMFVRINAANGNILTATKNLNTPYALGSNPDGYFFEAARSGTNDVLLRRSGGAVDQTLTLWPSSSQIHVTGVEGFSGGAFVYGDFAGTLTATGGLSVSTTAGDGFVLKVVNGVAAALVQLHATGAATIRGSSFRNGDLYLVGGYTGGLPDPLTGMTALSQAGIDFYIARLQSAGSGLSLTWAKGFPGAGDAYSGPVVADPAGFVTVSVRAAGDSDFGGGVVPVMGPNTRVLASYKSDGTHAWSRRLTVWPSALAVDQTGRLFVGGGYSQAAALDFSGKDAFGSGVDLMGSMNEDIFVAALSPASP